jgi:transposase InsO family protein
MIRKSCPTNPGHLCIYENLEEVREAVSEFVELYNSRWLIEKNGYLSPFDARKSYYEGKAA